MEKIRASIIQANKTKKQYYLISGTNTIGRELDNLIVVTDDLCSLSRHHAEIKFDHNRFLVKDLNSSNGTFVNDRKVTEEILTDGDVLRFGEVTFLVLIEDLSEYNNYSTTLPILTEFQPDSTRTVMSSLLTSEDQVSSQSVLRLREDDQQQRNAIKLKILLEVTQQLCSLQTYGVMLEKILELVFEIMNVDRGVVLMQDRISKELVPQVIKSRSLQENSSFYSQSIVQYVFEKGVAVICDNAAQDQRFSKAHSVVRQSINSAMCVPLKPSQSTIGVLYVDNLVMANLYSSEDLEFLTSLANQGAIAIENLKLREAIQQEIVQRVRLERFFSQSVMQRLAEGDDLEKIIETDVTALFSDISGFTQLSAQMPPRQVLEMLNEYFKVMVEEIIFTYEGTLEKYIADALLAVWGSPYQRPDDAALAVQAAIEMQWAMQSLNQIWAQTGRDLEIQIHIGLNSGRVAAGNIGSQKLIQYTNIGDTMNVASRICDLAKAGEILISESTLGQIKDLNLPMEPIPPTLIKGKSDPLRTFRILWQNVPSKLRSKGNSLE